MATITGTNGPDILTGTEGDDEIFAFDGFDVIEGLGGADRITVGAGEKRLNAGAGNDTVVLTAVFPQSQAGQFNGGEGFDTLDVSGLAAGFSFSTQFSSQPPTFTGFERFLGSAFRDEFRLADSTTALQLFGNGGDDGLTGGLADDLIDGGEGNDALAGGGGFDTLRGGAGNDSFGVGPSTRGLIDGGAGNADAGSSFSGSPTASVPAQVVEVDLAAGTISFNGVRADVTLTGIENWSFFGITSGGRGDTTTDLSGPNNGGRAFGNEAANLFTANTRSNATGAVFDGRGGNDTLIGSTGSDRLIGGDGDDVLRAENGGFDTVEGGAGSDTLGLSFTAVVDLAAQTVTYTFSSTSAGVSISGIENLFGAGGGDVFRGSDGANVLNGGGGNDVLEGRGGDDYLIGAVGDDTIDGGAGADIAAFSGTRAQYSFVRLADGSYDLVGPEGRDRLISIERLVFTDGTVILGEDRGGVTLTPGADQSFGTAANDTVSGGDGNDLLLGAGGDDTLYGDAGADTLNGESGADILRGGTGDDLISGETGDDFLFGDIGVDTLIGGVGADSLNGQEGDDGLFAGAGNDILSGEDGADYLFGDVGDDLQIGGAGNDIINGEGGADFLVGGLGDDLMSGETGSDIVRGEDGNDVLLGGFGADFDSLEGGAGVDVLFGEGGTDALFGGDGDDVAYGGGGADDAFTGGGGRDRMVFRPDELDGQGVLGWFLDFQTGQDVIDLRELDANTTQAGDQAFTLVNVFTFSAGQLVRVTSNGVTTLLGDTNGDGQPDFSIQIFNTVPVAGDFLL